MLRILAFTAAAVIGVAPAFADEKPNPLQPGDTWEAIRGDIIGEREILDGDGLYTLEAPFRANDAATVPIHIIQDADAPDVQRLYLVIDENPSPLAAEFTFGPAMNPLDIEARVRVDAYSNVRAIVEAADGKLYMTGRYVRGSGGCSAPGAKDAAAALAALGQMKARWFDQTPTRPDGRREAQVMLRHPNFSGLQRDPLTLLYIPPHFVDSMEIRQGDDLLFTMTGGISISEDPTFRFAYTSSAAGELSVTATDTEGATFENRFPIGM